MGITASVVPKDNENSTEKNLWHGVFPCILRDMVKNKTNERIPGDERTIQKLLTVWII